MQTKVFSAMNFTYMIFDIPAIVWQGYAGMNCCEFSMANRQNATLTRMRATITCFRYHSTIIPRAHIRAHMIIKKIREHMKKKDFATFANMR